MSAISDDLRAIDPRRMGAPALKKLGFTRMPILRVIRSKCIECAGTPREVMHCTSSTCALWPYRTGKNPFNKRKGNPEAKVHLVEFRKKKRKAKKVERIKVIQE